MSIKEYTSILQKGKVPEMEIKTIVDNIANMGHNERFTSTDAMTVINNCVKDSAFRNLFMKDPIAACAQLGINLESWRVGVTGKE